MAPTGPPSFVPGNRVPGYPVIRLRLFFIFLLPIVDGYRLFPVNNRPACTPLEVVTEVPSPCLAINGVPSTIRNEPREAKNEVNKLKGKKHI
jgi:hypothetical protein